MHCLMCPANTKSPLYAGFFCWLLGELGSNSRRSEFDGGYQYNADRRSFARLIVINEYNRLNSPARKDVSSWSEQDYYDAVHSDGFSQNYMLQNMCDEYLKLQNKR